MKIVGRFFIEYATYKSCKKYENYIIYKSIHGKKTD